jgi:hypothetical protein
MSLAALSKTGFSIEDAGWERLKSANVRPFRPFASDGKIGRRRPGVEQNPIEKERREAAG